MTQPKPTKKTITIDTWQTHQAKAHHDPKKLLDTVGLPNEPSPAAEEANHQFPLRAPQAFVNRITQGDPNDPLLKQILPTPEEMIKAEGFTTDPVDDKTARTTQGLLHKYPGRVLLITTGACGIHCRYCFRRHYPYADDHLQGEAWQQALDYIAADKTIHEVILSGGDPLTLSDQRLNNLVHDLETIEHIQRLRIHSRQPVVLPARMTDELVKLLGDTRFATSLVLHVNHPNELNDEVAIALKPLREAGITLLNQSVLLRGINDDADVLSELSEQLFQAGILPYYLHQLDRVQGAAHFEVDDKHALQLIKQLRTRLPGYLVPKLVREVAGEASKLPL